MAFLSHRDHLNETFSPRIAKEDTLVSISPFQDHCVSKMEVCYRDLKGRRVHDEQSFVSLILLLARNFYDAVHHSPPVRGSAEKAILEMQTLMASKENVVDMDLSATYFASQLFLKMSADFATVTQDSLSPSAVVLNALSVSKGLNSLKEAQAGDLIGYSSLMVLDSITALSAVRLSSELNKEVERLWKLQPAELAESVVSCLMPEEGNIRRLHSRLFEEARCEVKDFWPKLSDKQLTQIAVDMRKFAGCSYALRVLSAVSMIPMASAGERQKMFNPVSFFERMFDQLPRGTIASDRPLTAHDVEIFLVSLSVWIGLIPSSRAFRMVPCRLPLTSHQIKTWKDIAKQLNAPSASSRDPSSVMRVKHIISNVRLQNPCDRLKSAYGVFQWMERVAFSEDWLRLYAKRIHEMIEGSVLPTRVAGSADLFPLAPLGDNALASVDEEDVMLEHVNRYLASRYCADGEYLLAEQLLMSYNSFSANKLRVEIYEKWLVNARPDEFNSIEEKLKFAKAELRASDNTLVAQETMRANQSTDGTLVLDDTRMALPSYSADAPIVSPPEKDGDGSLNDTATLLGVRKLVLNDSDGVCDDTMAMFKPPADSAATVVVSPRKEVTDAGTITDLNASCHDLSFHSTGSHDTSFGSFLSAVSNTDMMDREEDVVTPTNDSFRDIEKDDCPSPPPLVPSPPVNESQSDDASFQLTSFLGMDEETCAYTMQRMENVIADTKRMMHEFKSKSPATSPGRTELAKKSPESDRLSEDVKRDLEEKNEQIKKLESQLAAMKTKYENEANKQILPEILAAQRVVQNAVASDQAVPTFMPRAPAAFSAALLSGSPASFWKSTKPIVNPIAASKVAPLATHPHPGHEGEVCLGCMDEEKQERALRTLDNMAKQWNLSD